MDSRRHILKYAVIIFAGLLGGFVNGFIGSAGGIILIFALSFLNKKNLLTTSKSSTESDLKNRDSSKDIFANVILTILPLSIVSIYAYGKKNSIDFSAVFIYIIPAILGGLLGAFLLDKVKVKFLKILFSLLIIYSGISMIFK